MMETSWIKLYRKIINDIVFDEPEVLKVWIWILCKAYYKETSVIIGKSKVDILPGQFPFGRRVAARELKMSESKVYRTVKLLEELGCISITPTSRYSIITVEKWGIFQGDDEQQANSCRTSAEQQLNTNKNIKNNKNLYNISSSPQEGEEAFYNCPRPMGGTLGKGVLILTDQQMDNLLDIMPLEVFDHYCDKLSSWLVNSKRVVKDHYDLIMKWYKEDYGKK